MKKDPAAFISLKLIKFNLLALHSVQTFTLLRGWTSVRRCAAAGSFVLAFIKWMQPPVTCRITFSASPLPSIVMHHSATNPPQTIRPLPPAAVDSSSGLRFVDVAVFQATHDSRMRLNSYSTDIKQANGGNVCQDEEEEDEGNNED